MRLGIFGGTFDPPHMGHSILAAEAFFQLQFDRLFWVLTPNPPHKKNQPITPLSERLNLVRAAIQDDDQFELSRVDIDRPPPHFAVDTVRLLKKEFPEADLVYVMGGDSLENLPSWHQPLEFVQGCRFIGVVRRPGDQIDLKALESQIPGITPKIQFVDSPLIDISASQIRDYIQQGHPYKYYLLESVYHLIRDRGLYQN